MAINVGIRRGQRQAQRESARQAQPMALHTGMLPAYEEANRAAGAMGQGMGMAQDAMGMSRDAAMGIGPSLAQEQMAAGRQAGLVDQMALMSQQQGTGLAGQQRQVSGMGAANQMGLARDTAALRANEIAQARAEYGQQAQNLAGMGLQQHLAAQGQYQNAAGQLFQGTNEYQMANRGMDIGALKDRRAYVQDSLKQGGEMGGQIIGQILKAIVSDERLKDDIEDGEEDALDALRGLSAVSYRYKDEKHGPTDRKTVGILAQDLERSRAGKSMIREFEDGKAVDATGALSLSLAGLAALTKKVDKLEGKAANGPELPGLMGVTDGR